MYAAAVVPGSPAAREGSLAVGDRIVAVSLTEPGHTEPGYVWEVGRSNEQGFYIRLVL